MPTPTAPPTPTAADWNLVINSANVGSMLRPSLVGYYDLSGVLFDYENVPGLVSAMNSVGFVGPAANAADWRVGLGRWEIATQVFDTLTDSTVCTNFSSENQSTFVTDLELIESRDWFTFTDGLPVSITDISNSRYALNYVRSVIDSTQAFGATPFVSIDHMPRALSANQTPNRIVCDASFNNGVSNNEPADPGVFAAAATGLVQRIVEGTGTTMGNDRPRNVVYWEIWNEPELATFWEPTLAADPDSFFDMAIATLFQLDAYRNTTANSNGQSIKIGLGSFVSEATAIATLQSFDPVDIPLDFISFHSYDDDPLVIVDAIVQTTMAIENSTNYQDIELVLAEWGPDLATRAGDQEYASSMSPALHAATVIALGASAGLDRSHNAIFYDFFAAIALGLIDNAGTPRPLYRAYELVAKLTTNSTQQLVIDELGDGRLEAGMGAALAAQDTSNGAVRVLLINRNSTPRTARITLNGSETTPTQLFIFDASSDPASNLTTIPLPEVIFELPARSIAVAEF